jgi:hypothetical protein
MTHIYSHAPFSADFLGIHFTYLARLYEMINVLLAMAKWLICSMWVDLFVIVIVIVIIYLSKILYSYRIQTMVHANKYTSICCHKQIKCMLETVVTETINLRKYTYH